MTQLYFFFLKGDRYKKTRRFCVISECSFDVADEKGRLWEVYDTAELGVKEFTRCSMSKQCVGTEKYLGLGVWSHCTSVVLDSAVANDLEQTSTVDAEPEGGLLVPFVSQHDDKKQAGAS
jgi:hypothetical protein